MIISRVYNNNVVEAKDLTRTVILQGKGIGFGKKAGDFISARTASKIFELADRKHYRMIRDILEEVPEDYWDLCIRIQDYTEEALQVKLNSSFYLSLLDHIYIAVKRVKKGIELSSIMTTEIELYYEDIYRVAKHIVSMMEEHFSLHFDDSEVYFISVHLLESVMHLNYSEVSSKVKEIVQMIEKKVQEEFPSINKESLDYSRFLIHTKRFANLVVTGKISDTQDTKLDDLYLPLKQSYGKQFLLVERIISEVSNQYSFPVGTNEKFYLFIHIIKISQ